MIAAPWLAGFLSFAVVLVLVPVVRYFCFRLNLYDQPGPLKIHTRLVPRLGGIAIATALVVGLASVRALVSPAVLFLLGAAVLIWLVGLIDDIRNLRPAIRFAAQFGAGTLLWAGGWRISFLPGDILNLGA